MTLGENSWREFLGKILGENSWGELAQGHFFNGGQPMEEGSMERTSMDLSTALEHSNENDGGEIGGTIEDRKSPVAKRGGTASDGKQGSPAEQKSVFSSLRGKAFALRAGVRKSASDSTAKTTAKTKSKLRIVANDKPNDKSIDKSIDKSVGEVAAFGGKPDGNAKRVAEQSAASFARGDYLVHPAHGVGYVRGVEAEEIAGARLDMIAISFEQERMVVRVPTCEYENCGLRSVSSPEAMEGIYDTLKTKRRIRKTMWGRRAQEYDNKIRSGDPVRLAQVVRELYRGEEQPSPSYSERQYYQLALERLSREVAVVEKIEERLAVEKLETILAAA